MTGPAASDYDAYAEQYAAAVTQREQGAAGDPYGLLPPLLEQLGDIADDHPPHTCLPPGTRFPRFLLLAFGPP